MDQSFDDLTRELGAATSRREALRLLGGFVGGALLTLVGRDRVWAQDRPRDPCKIACQRCSSWRQRTQCLHACRACPSPSLLCGPCGAVTCCSEGKVCTRGRCACPPGFTDCGEYCANLQNDSNNCGACGSGCTGGKVCIGGVCVCPPGFTDCGGTCVDLASDPSNCGVCANVCLDPAAPHCVAGNCGCAPGTFCDGICTDLLFDSNNCGACGTRCNFPFVCCGGACVDVTSDSSNCGGCFVQCSPLEACLFGTCQGKGPGEG